MECLFTYEGSQDFSAHIYTFLLFIPKCFMIFDGFINDSLLISFLDRSLCIELQLIFYILYPMV